MKSLVYVALALVIGGSAWYTFSFKDKAEEKIVKNEIIKVKQNDQGIYNTTEKKEINDTFTQMKISEKSLAKSQKLIVDNIDKKLEQLKSSAETESKRAEYEEIQNQYKEYLSRKLDSQSRQTQAKINYERQQFLLKQQNNSIDARKNYLAMQKAMKNRNINNTSTSTHSVINSQIARENYNNRQKEIIERMKNQTK